MSKAEQDVLAERQRQIDVEGWTRDHDDEHVNGELEDAAVCYLKADDVPYKWPWGNESWNPKSMRENFVRAAALRLAEKERLERLGVKANAGLLDDALIKQSNKLFKIVIAEIERLDRQEDSDG